MKKTKKIVLISGIAVICIFFVIYLAFSLFFMNHFYFGTVIGEVACGGRTPKEAEALIAEQTMRYTLEIQGREGNSALMTASEIGLHFIPGDALYEIAKGQNGFGWLSFWWKNLQYEMPMTLEYEEELLEKRMEQLYILQEKNMRKPSNAYIGEYNKTTGKYSIIEEDKGTYLIFDKVKEAIIQAIKKREKTLVLEDANCYEEAEITKDNTELLQFQSRINRYVAAKIVYDWHGMEEIIDGDLINEWLIIDREECRAGINAQKVREYVDNLSRKHDTYGKIRKFRTQEGKQIYIEPGNYGWQVNRKKETERLIKAIRAGRSEIREPEYLFTANKKGEDDIGDSYVEIDLTKQCLYLYAEGRLVTKTDFVSGNVSRGFTTPNGVYGLTYKTRNATLRGQGYETPVKYWMPFNGNIGMHDAGWRREFGGEIYLRNGSHGCINLPTQEAEKIYEYVYKGFPVICYTYEIEENNEQN